ncbi:hypothetical protein V8C44DRAFT_342199 [Trichoderma aethiopicum]
MARLKVFNLDTFNESNVPERDIILILEAWSAADCDNDDVARKYSSEASDTSRISQFFLRMDDTEGGVFTLEGVQREAEALLDGIMNLRRNSTDPPLLFFAQGFGGIILKKALTLTPRNIEELNGLTAHIWATIFVCSIHRWEDEQDLQTALVQILSAQHKMDNAKALHLSPALLKVVTEVNYAFYDSGVMLRSHFYSLVPSEGLYPEVC